MVSTAGASRRAAEAQAGRGALYGTHARLSGGLPSGAGPVWDLRLWCRESPWDAIVAWDACERGSPLAQRAAPLCSPRAVADPHNDPPDDGESGVAGPAGQRCALPCCGVLLYNVQAVALDGESIYAAPRASCGGRFWLLVSAFAVAHAPLLGLFAGQRAGDVVQRRCFGCETSLIRRAQRSMPVLRAIMGPETCNSAHVRADSVCLQFVGISKTCCLMWCSSFSRARALLIVQDRCPSSTRGP